MNEAHELEICSDFTALDGCWPECSCGWIGKPVDTVEAAEDAWDDHCDSVFMEATMG